MKSRVRCPAHHDTEASAIDNEVQKGKQAAATERKLLSCVLFSVRSSRNELTLPDAGWSKRKTVPHGSHQLGADIFERAAINCAREPMKNPNSRKGFSTSEIAAALASWHSRKGSRPGMCEIMECQPLPCRYSTGSREDSCFLKASAWMMPWLPWLCCTQGCDLFCSCNRAFGCLHLGRC